MTEKTPIDIDAIREGDTIRWQGEDEQEGTKIAIEYIARRDRDHRGWEMDGGEYYLLKRFERPTSTVPDVETLGHVHHGGRLILGVWRTFDYRPGQDGVGRAVLQNEREIPIDQVTGFTPAIAMPVAPTEEFVQQLVASVPTSSLHDRAGAVRAVLFAILEHTQREVAMRKQLDELDAVDAANEADR